MDVHDMLQGAQFAPGLLILRGLNRHRERAGEGGELSGRQEMTLESTSSDARPLPAMPLDRVNALPDIGPGLSRRSGTTRSFSSRDV